MLTRTGIRGQAAMTVGPSRTIEERRLGRGVGGIAPGPVPTEAHGVGGLGAERAAIQLLHAPAIVGTITIDICHGRLTRDAPVIMVP